VKVTTITYFTIKVRRNLTAYSLASKIFEKYKVLCQHMVCRLVTVAIGSGKVSGIECQMTNIISRTNQLIQAAPMIEPQQFTLY